ncbi:MAG: SDR family NAD(P)-dependent oxidoreductase [Hyphomicrobiales bacterium]
MTDKVAVIAGATRGIGFALVRALALAWRPTDTIYLTARRPTDGEAAVAKLAVEGIGAGWLPFDLGDPASPSVLAATLRDRHGGVDVAVLNGAYMARAGVPASADARPMIEVNNHGTLRFLRAMAPVLNVNGRLVVVASGFGVLESLPETLRSLFDTTMRGPDAIDRAMDRYVAAVEAGTADAEGWPSWVNIPSKVGQVAVTRAFAREYALDRTARDGVLVNAACPGLTLTDATKSFMDTVFKGRPAQTPDEAAVDLLWLIDLPPGTKSPYAELVQHRRVLPFGD